MKETATQHSKKGADWPDHEGPAAHWDPRSDAVQQDQIAAYDGMRAQCPVARSHYGYTSVFRHADMVRILNDHDTFSSAVSRFPSVPNGMDPPEHTIFRQLIEPYFTSESVEAFAPICEQLSKRLVATLPHNEPVEFMQAFASVFAVHLQCAFMGWSETLHQPLLQWLRRNHQATLSRDQEALNAVAFEFDTVIRAELDKRRSAAQSDPSSSSTSQWPDVTTRLLNERVDGRLLTDEEIISIVRNWTVGELGTIAAAVGIVVAFLARHPEIQQQLRQHPEQLGPAIDEILRIHPPLILNRRVATRATSIGGVPIEEGERLTLLWASANRDEYVFPEPDTFRLDRDPSLNLLYGAGIHVCPGAELARRELLIVIRALLDGSWNITADPARPPINAVFPAGGYSEVSVIFQR